MPQWAVVISVNPRLRGNAPDAEAPADPSERRVTVDRDMTVGRPSPKRHFTPDIKRQPGYRDVPLQAKFTSTPRDSCSSRMPNRPTAPWSTARRSAIPTRLQDGDVVGSAAGPSWSSAPT